MSVEETPAFPAAHLSLLGPLRLEVAGREVAVPGPRRRAVLVLLGTAEGRILSVDSLLDALWPSELPDTARATLQSHVSRIRGHLGPAADGLENVGGGYQLNLGEAGLDIARARKLLADAKEVASTNPSTAADLLTDAHALWRGPLLPDLIDVEPIGAWAMSAENLYREVVDALIATSIEAGRAEGVVVHATDNLRADPLREPAALLLMRALAKSGRSVEALEVARNFRRHLADEAGIDPSPAVGELERVIAGGGLGGVARRAGAVPTPVTGLIGRDSELAAVRRLIRHERLVTIVGPGGVGKTRLASEVALREPETAAVLLASIVDSSAIPHAIAAALDLQVVRGDVLQACAALIGANEMVLLLDNCEHLLTPVRDMVSFLLGACSGLKVLATSREPLGLPGECTSRLAPLPLPGENARLELQKVPSVAFFVQSAKRVRPGYDPDQLELLSIAQIVRHLDGIPLAIELAAGRLSSFALPDLQQRVGESIDVLAGGRASTDARHQTLRSTIEWSYALLELEEQRLLRHLSVFPDGVDLATAESIAVDVDVSGDPAAAIAHLVDASMILASFEGAPRYQMLETIRSYGTDMLAAAGETEEANHRLLRWAIDTTARISQTEVTPDEAKADALLRRELPNLRAAWSWAREAEMLNEQIDIVSALAATATWRDLVEVWGWSVELAGDPDIGTHRRAASVYAFGSLAAWTAGELGEAERLGRLASELVGDDTDRWLCKAAMALVHLGRGEFADAVAAGVEAAELSPVPDQSLGVAAAAATYAGRLDEARELLTRLRKEVTSPTLIALSEYVAGEIDIATGDAEDAEGHYRRAIELSQESGSNFLTGIASVGLMQVLTQTGRTQDALLGFRDLIDYWERTGGWIQQWTTLRNLASLLRSLGDLQTSALLELAADHSPDAPAVGDEAETKTTGLSEDQLLRISADATALTRAEVLAVARAAIDGHSGEQDADLLHSSRIRSS